MPPRWWRRIISLGRRSPAASSSLPGTPATRWSQRRGPRLVPAWPCSGWGLPCRPRDREARWALTPPFHPCLCSRRSHRRSVLCGTFRRLTTPGRYPAPCPVELGLSSTERRLAGADGRDPHSLPILSNSCRSSRRHSLIPHSHRRRSPASHAPGRSRTPNLWIRSPTLYPVELRAHWRKWSRAARSRSNARFRHLYGSLREG